MAMNLESVKIGYLVVKLKSQNHPSAHSLREKFAKVHYPQLATVIIMSTEGHSACLVVFCRIGHNVGVGFTRVRSILTN